MTKKLLKLAKMLLKFTEIKTDKGVLTVNEDLAPGIEVFIEDENGEYVAAPDGEYLTETSKIEVKDGKVESIETIEPEDKNEPESEPAVDENLEDEKPADEKPADENPESDEPDEKDLRISELEGLLKDRDSIISELTAKIKELEDKLNKPVEDPIEMKTQVQEEDKKNDQKINPALKYFQD